MPRFRLRTFLIAITAFCLLLGWRVAAVESVERPIRELESLGWELDYPLEDRFYIAGIGDFEQARPIRSYWAKLHYGFKAADLPASASLKYTGPHSTGRSLAERMELSAGSFNQLPSITKLAIASSHLDPEVVAPLAELKHLRSLAINSEVVDELAVPQIASLTKLDSLTIWDARLSEEEADLLRQHIPNCPLPVDFWKLLDSFRREGP